jgi:hypothetical protein
MTDSRLPTPTVSLAVSRAASLVLEAAVKPGKDLAMGGVDGHSDKHVSPDTQEMASNTLGQELV